MKYMIMISEQQRAVIEDVLGVACVTRGDDGTYDIYRKFVDLADQRSISTLYDLTSEGVRDLLLHDLK